MFEIKIGQTVKCLHCGNDILLDGKTFVLDCVAEYIVCPHCGAKDDVQKYHAVDMGETDKDKIETCTIHISTPEIGCPYKVGDKFITAIPDFDKPRFCVENFDKVAELTIEEVDLSDERFPRLRCKGSNGKTITVSYAFAPHFETLEQAEREVEEHNRKLQKKIDDYIAEYGQEAFDETQAPLQPPHCY